MSGNLSGVWTCTEKVNRPGFTLRDVCPSGKPGAVHKPTLEYVKKRTKDGKSKSEIIRFRPVKVPLRFIDFFALRNSKAVIHQFY